MEVVPKLEVLMMSESSNRNCTTFDTVCSFTRSTRVDGGGRPSRRKAAATSAEALARRPGWHLDGTTLDSCLCGTWIRSEASALATGLARGSHADLFEQIVSDWELCTQATHSPQQHTRTSLSALCVHSRVLSRVGAGNVTAFASPPGSSGRSSLRLAHRTNDALGYLLEALGYAVKRTVVRRCTKSLQVASDQSSYPKQDSHESQLRPVRHFGGVCTGVGVCTATRSCPCNTCCWSFRGAMTRNSALGAWKHGSEGCHANAGSLLQCRCRALA